MKGCSEVVDQDVLDAVTPTIHETNTVQTAWLSSLAAEPDMLREERVDIPTMPPDELRKAQQEDPRINGAAHKWFSSYLKNPTQTCLVNCNKSSERFLQCGVPRGTILDPLLFLLYINDLPNCLCHSQPRMYADDTSINFASNSVEEINECINSDLEEIRLWLAANKLTLNLTKTEFLLIGSRKRLSNLSENPSIKVNQIPVEQVSTTKSLGVYIDQNLNW